MCKTYGPSLPQADCIQVCEIVRGLPCLQHVQSCVAFEKDCAFAALWISGLWTSPKFPVDNFDISNLALLVHHFILCCASVLRLFWPLCVLLSLWPQEQAGAAYVAEQTLRQHHNGPGGTTSCTVEFLTILSPKFPTNPKQIDKLTIKMNELLGFLWILIHIIIYKHIYISTNGMSSDFPLPPLG